MESEKKLFTADNSYSQERVVTNTAASVGELKPIKTEADRLSAEAKEGECKAKEGECEAKEEESKAEEGECKAEKGECEAKEGESKAEKEECKAEEEECEAEQGECEVKLEKFEVKLEECVLEQEDCETEAETEAKTEATPETPTALSFADHSICLEFELMKLNLQWFQSKFLLSNMNSTNFLARLELKCHRRSVNGYYVTSGSAEIFGEFEGRAIDIERVTDWIAICCVAPSQHLRSVLRLSDAMPVVLPTYVKFQRRYTEPTLEDERSMLVQMLEKL